MKARSLSGLDLEEICLFDMQQSPKDSRYLALNMK